MYAQVGFTGYVIIRGGDRVIFNHVIANLGNAFDAESRVFTAPVDGLYFLSVSLCTGSPLTFTYFFLMHDGVHLVRGMVGNTFWGDCNSISATAHMHVGSEAWVMYQFNSNDGYY